MTRPPDAVPDSGLAGANGPEAAQRASDAKEEHRFPCPTCGADLRYDPADGSLRCDHCGHTEKLQDSPSAPAIPELDFERAIAVQLPDAEVEETRTSACQSCGAVIEFDPAVHARECPFCASPLVRGTGVNRHIKPGGLLPFRLDEEQARAAMTDWLGRLWLAPNGLQAYARKGRRMAGVYAPFWTFDARTETAYRGQRGVVYTETRTIVRDGKRQTIPVARVRWRSVRGRVARAFDDVLVFGSRSLPPRYANALEPWDLSGLVPYAPAYVAGFRAEAYTVELAEAWREAREIMDRTIERDIRFDIGGDRQRIDDRQTRIDDVTFKHVLLPVWVAAYRWRGRSYRFVVNGQTGRVRGERPWSPIKVALAVLAGLIALAVAAYLGSLQGGSY